MKKLAVAHAISSRITACALMLLLSTAMITLVGCTSGSTQTPSGSGQESAAEQKEAYVADPARQAPYLTPADSFAAGSGTQDDPWQIETPEQLALLSELLSDYDTARATEAGATNPVDGHYVLTADIALNDTADLSKWGTHAPQWGWMPISGNTNGFKGTFDGQGHTISGMYIYDAALAEGSENGVGLFANVNGGTVRDVSLTESYIATIDPDGSHYVGGIVGHTSDALLSGCTSNVVIEVGADQFQKYAECGGIVGIMSDGSIEDCAFGGSISSVGVGNMGGIAGYLVSFERIEGCTNTGTISRDNPDSEAVVGGIAGRLHPGTDGVVSSCVNEGDVSQGKGAAGGLFGEVSMGFLLGAGLHEDSDVTSDAVNLTVRDCANRGTVRAACSHEGDPVGGVAGTVGSSSDSRNVSSNDDGSFNGLKFVRCSNQGDVESAGEKEGVAGGIVGACSSQVAWSFEECENTGAVSAGGTAAGIVGKLHQAVSQSDIEICTNEGTIRSEAGRAGGVVGELFGFTLISFGDEGPADATVTGCVNKGSVSGGDSIDGIGGIVGSIASTMSTMRISDCLNTGELSGGVNCRVGGILGNSGFANASGFDGPCFVIGSCRNEGTIIQGDGTRAFDTATRVTDASGVLGGSALGGIVGYCKHGIVEKSDSLGEISLDGGESDVIVGAGGVCGMYLFAEGDYDSTTENTGLHDCRCAKPCPQAYTAPMEEDGIENVTVVDRSALEA